VQPDPTWWIRSLPDVSVKASYLNIPHIPAKGEADCHRASYPRTLQADMVQLPAFKAFLEQHLYKKSGHVNDVLRLAGRALGALQVLGGGCCELSLC